MAIQVTGVLTGPTQALKKKIVIRIVSLGGTVLIGSFELIKTDATTAAYDFQLEEGTFTLEVLFDGEYVDGGTVTVDGQTASPLTLEALFALAV